jgi:hypothetical protein
MSAASTPITPSSPYYLPVRQGWLDRRIEPILKPDLPIVDPHHHLWDRPGWRYLLDELLADTNSGHNIVATVFVQARAMVRAASPKFGTSKCFARRFATRCQASTRPKVESLAPICRTGSPPIKSETRFAFISS